VETSPTPNRLAAPLPKVNRVSVEELGWLEETRCLEDVVPVDRGSVIEAWSPPASPAPPQTPGSPSGEALQAGWGSERSPLFTTSGLELGKLLIPYQLSLESKGNNTLKLKPRRA
jgi:hypothetical protein